MAKDKLIRRPVPTLEQVKKAGYAEDDAKNIVEEQAALRAAEDADPALAEQFSRAAQDSIDRQNAAGEGMTEKPEVEDGVNPHAPDQPLTLEQQIHVKNTQLMKHRVLMIAAKKKHEQNMKEVGELRKRLAHGEAAIVDNEYERLTQDEHVLMGQLYAMENQLRSK